jgi:hypothetical protein
MTCFDSLTSVVETLTFVADAKRLCSEEERAAFCSFISGAPESGGVIPAHILRAIREEIEND